MTDKLDDKIIVKAIKEAWKIRLSESVELTSTIDGKEKIVLTPELRIRDSAGVVYTIKTVRADGATLVGPDGEEKSVSSVDLEKKYELD